MKKNHFIFRYVIIDYCLIFFCSLYSLRINSICCCQYFTGCQLFAAVFFNRSHSFLLFLVIQTHHPSGKRISEPLSSV